MKKHRNLSLTAKIILYILPFFVLIVFIIFLSYQYYQRVKENSLDDISAIFREMMDNLAYKYINLSEDIVLYSRFLSESPQIQELLQERKAGEEISVSPVLAERFSLLRDEFYGKIYLFQLYRSEGKLVIDYPMNLKAPCQGADDLKPVFSEVRERKDIVTRQFYTGPADSPLGEYLLYASPVFSPGQGRKVIGVFCSWLDLRYVSRKYFAESNFDVSSYSRPSVFLLNDDEKVLYKSGGSRYLSSAGRLPAEIAHEFPRRFLSTRENLLLKKTRIGEGSNFYYVIRPLPLSVSLGKSRVKGPELLLLLVSPKSFLQNRLMRTTTQVVEFSLVLVLLLVIPIIMILRAYYSLEKEKMKAIEKELKLAYDMQMAFLPKGEVRIAGGDFYGESVPAREVGGDFFDFIDAREHSIAVSIGDVSGKGMPSALMMSMTKTLISFIAERVFNPSEVLSLVNRSIHRISDTGLFVTVFLGFLDLEGKVFTYANAGHNHPILCRGGKITELEGSEMPLGCMDDTVYQKREIALMAGDILILYTDGVSDVWNEKGEQVDENGIWETALELQSASAQEMAKALFNKVEGFQGKAAQYDDRTLLVMRIDGEQEGASRER
ncbi:MAG: SpoIIE family protein phosphatase [Candidatus Eremiobacteraeota bacterium]|nr:SpoIIE family protein phosphatase [Candidatus Eremiobacteraeota bacterium]